MHEPVVTVVGNVVETPILRHTGAGVEVANFRIASTSRRFDRARNSWVDGGTLFLKVACWRQLGVNTASSLRRGDPVVVSGRLFSRTYETNGQTRWSYEVEAQTVGHDLTRGTSVFERTGRRQVDPPEEQQDSRAEAEPEGATQAA